MYDDVDQVNILDDCAGTPKSAITGPVLPPAPPWPLRNMSKCQMSRSFYYISICAQPKHVEFRSMLAEPYFVNCFQQRSQLTPRLQRIRPAGQSEVAPGTTSPPSERFSAREMKLLDGKLKLKPSGIVSRRAPWIWVPTDPWWLTHGWFSTWSDDRAKPTICDVMYESSQLWTVPCENFDSAYLRAQTCHTFQGQSVGKCPESPCIRQIDHRHNLHFARTIHVSWSKLPRAGHVSLWELLTLNV